MSDDSPNTIKPASTDTPPANAGRKMAIEFLPLLAFFISYKMGGIFWATGIFMAAMTISVGLSWHFERHIGTMLKVNFAIVAVMGGLTFYLQDATFVYMKPTIIYSFFAIILATGLLRGRSYLKLVMEAAFPPMVERGWTILTRNWMGFFISLAAINEFVWRNFDESTWVNVKVWGFIPLTLVFAASQMPTVMKYIIEEDSEDESDAAP